MSNLTDSAVHGQDDNFKFRQVRAFSDNSRSPSIVVPIAKVPLGQTGGSPRTPRNSPSFTVSLVEPTQNQNAWAITTQQTNRIYRSASLGSFDEATSTDYHITITSSENKEEEEDEKDYISEGFIQSCNKRIGHRGNQRRVEKQLQRMRALGGLEPSADEVDIPAARIGLAMLAGLHNETYKIRALESLLELLKKDQIERGTANGLVRLAIKLMEQMGRDQIQTQTLDVQIRIATVYNILAEVLQRHYANQHINAITEELKTQLIRTAKDLELLNRQENLELQYHVKCALEGIRRLKDDCRELIDVLERILCAVVAPVLLYCQNGKAAIEKIEEVFKDLDPRLPGHWYDNIMILKSMAKDVNSEEGMTFVQIFIGSKCKKLNWKFTYTALEILFGLALNGKSEIIRKRAFEGIKRFGSDFPGFSSFIDFSEFSKYTDFSPVTHLERPRRTDLNIRIRRKSTEYLIKFIEETKDETLRRRGKMVLGRRLDNEKDLTILEILQKVVPANRVERREWYDE